MRTFLLYLVTAIAESVGCYLPWVWLWAVDGIRPSAWDACGVAVVLAGMSIIAFQPR